MNKEIYNIGTEKESMEKVLMDILRAKKLHISFAETVTGGMLVSRLVDVPGASDVLSRSFVTYGNDAKNEILGVDPGLIEEYGVVSAEVAEAMVKGLKKISKADVNISVTGYAGGADYNPDDGLCYFAISYEDIVDVEKHVFKGSRNEVRYHISSYILWKAGQIISSKR
jgi:nicotinamide-nucleotide amidase